MMVLSYEQRKQKIRSRADLERQMVEARQVERHLMTALKASANRIKPTAGNVPTSILRSMAPTEYRRFRQAQDTRRKLEINYNKLCRQIIKRQGIQS